MPRDPDSERPALESIRRAATFRRWYWLKSELVAFARSKGLPTAGNRPELTERIAHWLSAGEVKPPERRVATSRFDWRREELTPETLITDSYRNTRNMRAFMKTHAGTRFAFSNEFMAWMRANSDRTLADAVRGGERVSSFRVAVRTRKKLGIRRSGRECRNRHS